MLFGIFHPSGNTTSVLVNKIAMQLASTYPVTAQDVQQRGVLELQT